MATLSSTVAVTGASTFRVSVGRFAKVVAAFLIAGFFLAVCMSRLPFTTVSPDSIRFMHFAQINADRAQAEGGTATNTITAALRTIKGMNQVDYNRGRIVQAMVYGVDTMTRWMLPTAGLNLLMILVLAGNAAMASRLATRDLPDPDQRLNVALLAWIFLISSSLVISPVMLVTLYGKYVWVTFLLPHFLARRRGWKIFWLIPAAYSDEIGLVAVALVVFFHVGRSMMQNRTTAKQERRAVLQAAAFGAGAAVTVILVYFGISAVVFSAGAEAFRDMALHQLRDGVIAPGSVWEMAVGVFWRAEIILIGFSTGTTVLTTLIGAAVLAAVGTGVARQYRRTTESSVDGPKLPRLISAFLFPASGLFFYTYWTLLFLAISILILPGPVYDLGQYSYPAAIALSLLLVKAVTDGLGPRRSMYVFGALSVLHLALLPRITAQSVSAVESSLLPDNTVSSVDMQRMHASIEELRTGGGSGMFDSINNGQEIDFSATWYYSRVRWFGTATQPHWPVQGTVRVLTWPTRVQFKCVSRDFMYTKPEFVDGPCSPN